MSHLVTQSVTFRYRADRAAKNHKKLTVRCMGGGATLTASLTVKYPGFFTACLRDDVTIKIKYNLFLQGQKLSRFFV